MRRYRTLLVKATLSDPRPLGLTPPQCNPYLNATFFSQVNGLLDDAEARCADAGYEKYLRNVRYERIPVDGAALNLWHRFSGQPGFAPAGRAPVLKRYNEIKSALIVEYKTAEHHSVRNGMPELLKAEIAAFEVEAPAEFKDRNPNILYAFNVKGPGVPPPVADPDAAGGYAMRLGQGKPGEHKLPFSAKINDQALRKDFQPILKLDKVPVDSRYHWYKINTVALTPDCGFWTSVQSWIPMKWAALPPPNNELEVWASLKFSGPAYVPGSTGPDEVRLDRMLAVAPLTAQERAEK